MYMNLNGPRMGSANNNTELGTLKYIATLETYISTL